MPSFLSSTIRRDESGQGLTEYIILVGLIALVVYLVVQSLGGHVKSAFSQADSDMVNMQSGWK